MDNQAILSVSLKDYKKKIEELRASLLSLENTSTEYQKIAEEIKERQTKLNEVMSVGKNSVNAVAGSYNALSQEMSALKKEWKNMEIGTEEWTALAEKINSINEQLKDADAQVGVFSRNVGDYANQFTEAFEQCFNEAGKLGGAVGGVMGQVQSLLPQIKKVAQEMKQSGKGIASSLSAIGLLITVIVKEIQALIKNWDFVRVAFTKGGKEIAKQLTLESRELEKQNEKLEQQSKLMSARGDNSMTILANEIKQLQKISDGYADLSVRMAELYGKRSEQAKEAWNRQKEAAEGFKAKALEAQVAVEGWIASIKTDAAEQGMTDLQRETSKLTREFNSAKEAAYAMFDAGIIGGTELLKLLGDIREAYNLALETAKKKEANTIWQQQKEQVKSLLEEIDKNSKTEIQNLTDKYNKEKKLLEKFHKDTTELTRQYNKKILEIQEQAKLESYNKSVEYYNRLKALENPEIQLQMDFNDVREKIEELDEVLNTGWSLDETKNVKITKEMMEALESLRKYGIKTEKDLVVAYKETLNQFTELEAEIKRNDFNQWAKTEESKLQDVAEGSATYYLGLYQYYKDYIHKMVKYPNEDDIDFEIRQKNIKKATEEALRSFYMVTVETEQMRGEQQLLLKEYQNTLANGFEGFEEQMSRRLKSAKDLYDGFKKSIIEYGKLELGIDASQFEEKSNEFRNAYQEILMNLPQEMFDKNLELLGNYVDAESALLEQRRQNWFDLANGIGDLMGSMADYYEADIDAQIKNGKMSEKEGEKQYKKVQALKVSQAVIQTISGAIAAFMGCQELGQPWGLILGGVQAAAVTAAGAAQIKQIQSQNPYSSSGLNGGYTSPAVTPRLNEYNPDRVQNLTSQSDTDNLQSMLENTNVYVRVSDIDAAQNKGRVRVSESSF